MRFWRKKVVTVDPDRLAEIEARTQAASEGPWKWIGNQDTHQVYLGTMMQVVLGTLDVERTKDDRDIEHLVSWLWDNPPEDMPPFQTETSDEWGDTTIEYDDAAAEAWLRERATEIWLQGDEWDTPPTDRRIAVRDGWTLVPLESTAIYEVCPEATDRNDRRVYRADYRRTRSADAEFIAHSRADIEWLLNKVKELSS